MDKENFYEIENKQEVLSKRLKWSAVVSIGLVLLGIYFIGDGLKSASAFCLGGGFGLIFSGLMAIPLMIGDTLLEILKLYLMNTREKYNIPEQDDEWHTDTDSKDSNSFNDMIGK